MRRSGLGFASSMRDTLLRRQQRWSRRRGDFCSYRPVSHQPGCGIVAKRASKAGGQAGRGGGDHVSLAEAASDRRRIKIAEPFFELLRERALDRKGKLGVLEAAAIPNLWAMLRQLCDEAADPGLARSDVALCLAVMTGQLGAALAELMRLEEAATRRANPPGSRHSSHKLMRARAR